MRGFPQGSHCIEKPGKSRDLSWSFFPVLKSGIFYKTGKFLTKSGKKFNNSASIWCIRTANHLFSSITHKENETVSLMLIGWSKVGENYCKDLFNDWSCNHFVCWFIVSVQELTFILCLLNNKLSKAAILWQNDEHVYIHWWKENMCNVQWIMLVQCHA